MSWIWFPFVFLFMPILCFYVLLVWHISDTFRSRIAMQQYFISLHGKKFSLLPLFVPELVIKIRFLLLFLPASCKHKLWNTPRDSEAQTKYQQQRDIKLKTAQVFFPRLRYFPTPFRTFSKDSFSSRIGQLCQPGSQAASQPVGTGAWQLSAFGFRLLGELFW